MTERVGHCLLDEAIRHQTRSLAQRPDARVDLERHRHLGIGAAPMRNQRLERLDKTELLERGRAQIGKDPPVLALQLSDLGLDRARGCARGGLVADRLRQHRRACAQGEKMGPNSSCNSCAMSCRSSSCASKTRAISSSLARFKPSSVSRERIDLRIEIADLRRSVPFRARGIVAGFKLRERRPGDPEGPDRAPDQEARHDDRRDRHQSALERVLPRFVPDLVDLVPWIRDQDNRLRPAVLHRDRNDGRFGGRADKGAKPARRLGLPVRLAQN